MLTSIHPILTGELLAHLDAMGHSRHDFYAVGADAFVIVRTDETRTYADAILRKGRVGMEAQAR